MGDLNTQHNIGALGDLVRLTDHGTTIAAGSGDATTITGNTVDRMGFSNGSMPRSALMGVIYEATLASGQTLSYGFDVQDSPDGTNYSDYQTVASAVFATGPSGGGAVKGQANIQVDLNGARRFIRFNYKPTHSATGTDTSYGDGVGFVAGFDRLAAPNS